MHFDVGPGLNHVTFDDGKVLRRSLPWGDVVEARWEHARPEVIEVEIGGYRVEIEGHNLIRLFAAIEERTLLRVRAQPALASGDHKLDTYVTELHFSKMAVTPVRRRRRQLELELDA
jgi:hypothetical protein